MRLEDCTLDELLKVFRTRSEDTYSEYKQALKGSDEALRDRSYKRWAHADDCLASLVRVIEMVRADI